MKKLIALPLLFIIAISACANDFPDISVKELQKALEKGNVAVIDVNGARTFDKGHIPTAIHYSSSKDKLSSLLPKDKNTLVVSYCGGPSCRAYKRGAEAAVKLGYKNVKHLSAGISGWKRAGAKISSK